MIYVDIFGVVSNVVTVQLIGVVSLINALNILSFISLYSDTSIKTSKLDINIKIIHSVEMAELAQYASRAIYFSK